MGSLLDAGMTVVKKSDIGVTRPLAPAMAVVLKIRKP